ncbi:MAG: hypothetical protein ACI95C_002944 [Pseudohongiellaceae bacterium]
MSKLFGLYRTFYSCSIILTLGFAATTQGADMTAFEVMQKVDARYDGDSSIGEFTMVLIDRRDRQRTRNLRIYSKDFDADTKSLSLFESPADIRGTAYLNVDWADANQDDDSWLYLPALQRVKRIASSDTSDSFMGSDFTFADINGYELDWFDYSFVSESDNIDSHEVWVIDVTPKPAFKDRAEEATGYSKMQAWVRKDIFLQVRGQAWELKGNRIKYFNSSEIELIDDIWTTKRLQAISTRNGRQEHASVLQINSIRYNVDVDDSAFSTESMQRGLD